MNTLKRIDWYDLLFLSLNCWKGHRTLGYSNRSLKDGFNQEERLRTLDHIYVLGDNLVSESSLIFCLTMYFFQYDLADPCPRIEC